MRRFSKLHLFRSFAAAWLSLTLLASNAGTAAENALGLRFLTYNVWGLPRPLLKKASRFEDLKRLIPELSADVIGLQETFDRRTRVLDRLEGYPYLARGPKGRRFRQFNSGLIIASKYPIVATDSIEFEGLCAGFDCLANKGMQYARIAVPGLGEIDVFNTHMNAHGFESVRLEQVDLIVAFVLKHSDPALRPLVMLGDYNFEPDSAPYLRLVDSLRLRDSHLAYVGRHPDLPPLEREGLSSDPRRNPNIPKSQSPKRIDYVFTRFDLREVETIRTRLVFDAPVGGRFLSDHFGVAADVGIQVEGAEEASDSVLATLSAAFTAP